MSFLSTLCSALYFVALVSDISSVDSHTASSIRSPQRSFESLPSHITGDAPVTGRIGSRTLLSLQPVTPNPAVQHDRGMSRNTSGCLKTCFQPSSNWDSTALENGVDSVLQGNGGLF